jgi:hypothetical protein
LMKAAKMGDVEAHMQLGYRVVVVATQETWWLFRLQTFTVPPHSPSTSTWL